MTKETLNSKTRNTTADLGFQTDNYMFNQHGHGNTTLDYLSLITRRYLIVVTNGSPVNFKIFLQRIMETNESQALSINEKVWDTTVSVNTEGSLVLIQIRNCY